LSRFAKSHYSVPVIDKGVRSGTPGGPGTRSALAPSCRSSGVLAMVHIELKEGDRAEVEAALKKFKRDVIRAGILKEIRRRQAYMKPSVARKEKAKIARSRGRRKYTTL
jgi:small subunit ribosomal protein S21